MIGAAACIGVLAIGAPNAIAEEEGADWQSTGGTREGISALCGEEGDIEWGTQEGATGDFGCMFGGGGGVVCDEGGDCDWFDPPSDSGEGASKPSIGDVIVDIVTRVVRVQVATGSPSIQPPDAESATQDSGDSTSTGTPVPSASELVDDPTSVTVLDHETSNTKPDDADETGSDQMSTPSSAALGGLSFHE